MYLRKADYQVSQMQAFFTQETFVPSVNQLSDVRDAIEGVPIEKLRYKTQINHTIAPTTK